MSSRTKRIVRRAAALAIGAVVAIACSELGYRWIRAPALGPTTNPAYVEHDAELGWVYRPHASARHKTREFDVTIQINARGFRGPEWDEKRTDRPRVLVLGDSYAFGWGVEHVESFTSRLQTLVPEWEILNAAVSGYGTDQEYLLLMRLLPDVQPDLVVDVYCSNDGPECSSRSAYGKPKPYFVRGATGLELRGVPVQGPSWLERSSLLYRAITKGLEERASADRIPDVEKNWGLVCEIYREMAKRLDRVPLVVVSDEARLAHLAAAEPALRHVDLRPVFQSRPERLTFRADGHWTPAAHALIATELSRALRPLLP